MSNLTKAEINEIHYAMDCTWQAIGGDMLAAVQQETGENSMDKAEVIEVVLDADRMASYGNIKPETLKKFNALTYEERIKIAEEEFVFATYGF